MISALEKTYAEYEDEGGRVAIIGFNFQAYSGIYHMLYLHKNKKKFKMSFETEDDIIIKNETEKKKLKVQVKSENLTRGKLLKEENVLCMLGKVLHIDGYDHYIISFPNETGKALKKVATSIDTLIGGDCYEYNPKHDGTPSENNDCESINDLLNNKPFKGKKILFQEMPFTKDSNNSYFYLMGYSESSQGGEKALPLTNEQLLALLGLVYDKSSKKIIPKEVDNTIFDEIEEEDEKEKLIREYIAILKQNTSPIYEKNLLKNRGEYLINQIYYNEILGEINIPIYDDEKSFIDYFKTCSQILKDSLTEIQKIAIDRYIIAWYILDGITKGEE